MVLEKNKQEFSFYKNTKKSLLSAHKKLQKPFLNTQQKCIR